MFGGGGGGVTWSSGSNDDDCQSLSDQTPLSSPNSNVLKQLKVGDLLDVKVNNSGSASIVEALFNGQVAGTITSRILLRIVECIQAGHTYEAEVISIHGGACTVHVKLK